MNIAEKPFASRIGMSVEEIKPIIKYLESPDPNSNIKAHEGRRIIALSKVDEIEENRGYLVVNKQFYAEKGNPRTSAQRVSKHRKKEKILQLFNELDVCNDTETLPEKIETILSISLSSSISLEILKYAITSNIDLHEWMRFEAYRKTDMKAPLKTDKGRKTLINFLSKYSRSIQKKIISQTIDNEWKGLFELKEKKDNRKNYDQDMVVTGKRLGLEPRPGETCNQFNGRVHKQMEMTNYDPTD